MTSSVTPVLVAGAGPSGLVAALVLLQNQIPVRIIDKAPQYHISQRSNGVWPRTFEVFHLLHTYEMHQRATPIYPVREYKAGTLEPSRTFSMFTGKQIDSSPSIPYNVAKFLGQPTIEGILRSHIERYGCSVELATELESFEDDGKRVLAKLVKKKDGQELSETFEASFIIGADGAKGVTRKQLGLKFLGETRQDLVSVIGDICIENKDIPRNYWNMFGNRSANFVMLRPSDDIAPDGFQFLVSGTGYEPNELIADEKLLFKCMSEVIGQEIQVRKLVFASVFRPNIRMVDKFGVGRVFVSGDAAHVHSPTGGQGLNSSVQDALNLAWKVSLVYKGISPMTLLDSYTAERLPVIAEMLNLTTGMLNNILHAPTAQGAMAREERLNMLGVNYRSSPIVVDEFTSAEPVQAYKVLDEGTLVAGDRAPDAPELAVDADGMKTRLFDVFSTTHHTVLVFTPDPSAITDVLEALREYPQGLVRPVLILFEGSEPTTRTVGHAEVVVDNGGHAYRAYLVVKGEQKVVVVRPDGVVGAIVRGVEGVGGYFDKIFVNSVTV